MMEANLGVEGDWCAPGMITGEGPAIGVAAVPLVAHPHNSLTDNLRLAERFDQKLIGVLLEPELVPVLPG